MTSGILVDSSTKPIGSAGVTKVSLAWVATSGGAVSQTFTLPAGTIKLVEIIPNNGVAPSADYTVAITDPNGISLLSDGAGGTVGGAGGGSLSASVATNGVPLRGDLAVDGKVSSPMWTPGGTCTLTIASAGNGGTGIINLYVQ